MSPNCRDGFADAPGRDLHQNAGNFYVVAKEKLPPSKGELVKLPCSPPAQG